MFIKKPVESSDRFFLILFYDSACINTCRLLSIIERKVAPRWMSAVVMDCIESRTRICWFDDDELFMTVSAMAWFPDSVTITVSRFSSSNLPARNIIVEKLASVSAEQPENAA